MSVFWAMNSFRQSFWIVPPSFFRSKPSFSALAMYMAQMTEAGGLMVMDAVTSSRWMPRKRRCMSSTVSMATPHLPHSPRARGESVSYPMSVGKSKAVLRPRFPVFDEVVKPPVGVFGPAQPPRTSAWSRGGRGTWWDWTPRVKG